MMWRTQILTILFLFGANGFGATGCNHKTDAAGQASKPVAAQTKQTPVKQNGKGQRMKGEVETLNGNFSIGDPFIVVARDEETYAALRAMSKNSLPEFNGDYFRSHVVVAAFLGQRRTGGYSVQITDEGNDAQDNNIRKIVVEEMMPPKGAMVAQVFTAPSKIVSVKVDERQKLKVAIGNIWTAAARPFQISTGEFTVAGGITGHSHTMNMQGTIGVLREGNLATFLFNVINPIKTGESWREGNEPLALRETATGIVDSSDNVTIKTMGSSDLVPMARLQASGKFQGDSEGRLSLSFSSLSLPVSDHYTGSGSLEATATAPPRPKRQVID